MTEPASDIQIGKSYQVVHLNRCNRLHRKRLMAMGFIPGAIFEALRFAPLGDPIEVKIKGYALALRRKELLEIHFEDV
jgi:Fe2+ transport system protein FeoA